MRFITGILLSVFGFSFFFVSTVPGSAAEWMFPTIGFGCAVAGLALIGLAALDYRRR